MPSTTIRIHGSARTVVVSMRLGLLIATSTAALLGGFAVAAASAQEITPPPPTGGPGGGLEDIVVTARKVAERISDVPLAITALSDRQISERGIVSINEISAFTPSFRFQNTTPGSGGRADRSFSTLTFRGLALSGDYFTTAGGLLFVDGAPVIGSTAPTIFELERVEVLKGPQSAFFGRSAFSGAINFVSKDPPSKLSGEVNASVASFDSASVSGSIGGPLIPGLLNVRVGAAYDNKGGEYTNQAAPFERFGTQRTTTAGLLFLLTPADGLRIKGAFSYVHDDDGPPATIALKGTESNCNLGGTLGAYFCGELPTADHLPAGVISGNYVIDPAFSKFVLQNALNFPTIYNPNYLSHGGLKRDLIQTSIRGDYEFGSGYTLSSITAYHRDKVEVITDLNFRYIGDTLNPHFGVIPNAPQYNKALAAALSLTDDFSQEVRVTSPQDKPFRWLLGGNYLRASSYYANGLALTQIGPLLTIFPPRLHPNTPALFGAAYYDFHNFTLSGELRYQIDNIAQDVLTSGTSFLATPLAFRQTYRTFQPRATLTYHIDKDMLIYGLYARGYRPGGFNTNLFSLPAATQAAVTATGVQLAYGQESIDNYEGGIKGSILNNRVQFSLDGYYEQYRNGQISQSDNYQVSPTSVIIGTFTRNTGKIDLYGIEAEGSWQVTRALQLNSTFAWNENRIISEYCGSCLFIDRTTSAAGRKLPYAPRYTATLGAQYQGQITETIDWYARGDYFYRGKIFVDPANQAYIGDKSTVNLRVGAHYQNYTLEVYCKNCTNDLVADAGVYNSSNFILTGTGQVGQEIRYQLPERRIIGLRGGLKF